MPLQLQSGDTVAVIGGGPAGAFFALELLQSARSLGKTLKVVVFEKHRVIGLPTPNPCGNWHGCNFCAGGISPRLYDVLETMGLHLPDSVVQSRVDSIMIQGFWKNIEVEVPATRKMFSVFRGSRPSGIAPRIHGFDAFLLEQALAEGAKLISAEVLEVTRSGQGRPVITFLTGPAKSQMEVAFCVFACGINEQGAPGPNRDKLLKSARLMMPGFQPPPTRQTLIFELAAHPRIPPSLRNSIFFVEYGSKEVPLEMCSLLPKRDCITVVLIGESVDRAHTPAEKRQVIEGFLKLPHIRRLVSPVSSFESLCMCGPRMVVGVARHPFGDRVAAVGDLVTSRLYKDGILSAQKTASALAEIILKKGIDAESLQRGYSSTLSDFSRNNRCAKVVFFLHRLFFSSSVLSRVLYQAVITERKTTPVARRQLESILWRIASGDDEYGKILRFMLRPATLWSVITGGAIITLRNYLTELVFGLRWEGFGRFTTGVSIERLEEKRKEFARLIALAHIPLPSQLEFESMYTIKIAAPRELILEQLETFGEPDRAYLRPRWMKITRVEGSPHEPGCVIRYEVLLPQISFALRLENIFEGHLAVYRVMNGFARGGVLLFEVERGANEVCLLSIYVAFNFPRGTTLAGRAFWTAFRWLFPAFVHDVLWNHSLCQLRDVIEKQMSTKLETMPTTS